MKIKALILTVLISIAWVNVAFADAAYKAYKSGNHSEALRMWKSQAEDGDAMSQYNVGFMHQNGYGTLKDRGTALKWFEKSAYAGHSDAQLAMARHHINKAVGDMAWSPYTDFSKARYWTEKVYKNKDTSNKTVAEEWWDKYNLSDYTAPYYMKKKEEESKSFFNKAKSWFD